MSDKNNNLFKLLDVSYLTSILQMGDLWAETGETWGAAIACHI